MDKTIEIKSSYPKKLLEDKLSKYKKSKVNELAMDEMGSIIRSAVKEFKEGKISLDQLSSLSNHLWSQIPGKDQAGSDVARALYSGAELSFNLRNIKSKETEKIFLSNFKELINL